jgi:hypothetical protein
MKQYRIVWLMGATLAVVGVLTITLLAKSEHALSSDIRKQYQATLLVPRADTIEIKADTAEYAPADKLLTYHVIYQGSDLILSEQPTPEQFNDFPDLFEKLLGGMGKYKSIDVELGTVHLTRPPSLKGGQTAVMNTKGTLLFVKPDKDLSEAEWRLFFQSLEVDK